MDITVGTFNLNNLLVLPESGAVQSFAVGEGNDGL